MHKQVFSLRTGKCFSEGEVLPTYPVRNRDGVLEVGAVVTGPLAGFTG